MQAPCFWKATVTDARGTCAAVQKARLMQTLWLQARSGPETTRLCGLCSWEEGHAQTSPPNTALKTACLSRYLHCRSLQQAHMFAKHSCAPEIGGHWTASADFGGSPLPRI